METSDDSDTQTSATDGSSDSDSDSADSSDSESTTGEPLPLITQDGFDPRRDRWVRRRGQGQGQDSLVTVDPLTGEETVLVDSWPWPAEDFVVVRELALDRLLDWAYVFVDHNYYNPRLGHYCQSENYVRVDLETGEVEHLAEIHLSCCDDSCGARYFHSPVVDPHTETLRYIYADCDNNTCDYSIRAAELNTLEVLDSEFIYDGYCDWEPDCTEGAYDEQPWALTVSPTDEEQVLSFTEGGEWFLLSHEASTIQTLSALPPTLEGVALDLDYYRKFMLLDYELGRSFAVVATPEGYATILQPVDGEPPSPPTLVHASGAGDDPALSTRCIYDAAFDSLRNRVLYYREQATDDCPQDAYLAVDIESGTVELLTL